MTPGACNLVKIPAGGVRARTHLQCLTCKALVPIATMSTEPGKCPPRLFRIDS